MACEENLSVCIGALTTSFISLVISVTAYLKSKGGNNDNTK